MVERFMLPHVYGVAVFADSNKPSSLPFISFFFIYHDDSIRCVQDDDAIHDYFMAGSGRHSYSIPGASLLKPRSSSKVWVPSQSARHEEHSYLRRAHHRQQQQQPSYAPVTSNSRDRDTRQATLSRAYSVPVPQETSRSAPSARPPSANGYRTQTQPQVHQSGGYVPVAHFPSSQPPTSYTITYSSSRPLHSMPQRSTAAPQASSSKTGFEASGTESRGGGVFAKMFSRVRSTSTPAQQPSPAGSGTEDNQKSARRHKRSDSAQAQPVAYLATSTSMNPPASAPPAGRSMSEQQATKPTSTREAEREERRRRKESEKEKVREERHREKEERRAKERQRAESAALEAKQKAEQQASAVKTVKTDRDRERPPSRREEKQVQSRHNSISTTQPQYLSTTTYQATAILPGNARPPSRESQQVAAVFPTLRPLGVPIQPSNSSSQSTVSNRGHISNPAAPSSQRTSLDVPQPGSKPPLASVAPGIDDKARKEAERDREREERRARRAERERQKEAERLAAAERERLEIERLERERRELREKERERERSFRHRAQREKVYSLPVNLAPGVMSGSDNEKSSRKESRHNRSQSHSAPAAPQSQPYTMPTEPQRPESRRDIAGHIPPSADFNPQTRYDQVVYPRMSQATPPYPPAIPQKYEQSAYQRAVSDAGPNAHAHQSTAPKPSDRARTDPVIPPPILPPHINGSVHTSVTMMSWSEPYPPVPPKVISIHAAQGPPDSSPARHEQKVLERPAPEPIQASLQSGQDHDGHPRMSSHDYSTFPARAAGTSTPSSRPPSTMPIQPQNVPTYASSSSSRFHSSSIQPQPVVTSSGAQYNLHPRTDVHNAHPQAEKGLSPSGGPSTLHPHGLGAPPMSAPVPSSGSNHQVENGYVSSSMPSSVPYQPSQGNSPKGYAAVTQPQGNSPKTHSASQVPSQASQPMYVAQAASSNSNNNPSQRASHQVPGASQGGLFPSSGAVARTPSNTSQGHGGVPGYSYQQPPPAQASQGHYAVQNPSVQATAMYSSAQNSSVNSRASYAPSNQQQHVLSAYSQSQQSQSQPQHSSYPYSASTSSLHTALPLRSDARSSPNMHPHSQAQQYQQYSMRPSSSTQDVHYSSNPSADSQGDSHIPPQSHGVSSASAYYASLNSHPSSSHPSLANSGQSYNPAAISSTHSPQQPVAMYNNSASRALDPKSQQQSALLTQKASAPAQQTGTTSSNLTNSYDNSRTPRPIDYSPNQYTPSSSSHQTTLYPSATGPTSASIKSTEATSRHVPDSSMLVSRQHTPHQTDVPSSATPKPYVQQIPPTQIIAQPIPVRSQQDIAASTSTRVALPGHTSNHASSRLPDFDSPPPLTPSTSSHESHDEILMTPSSLDPAKGEPQEVSVTIQRPEKKKVGGIFGIFRSSSKSPKEHRDIDESRDQESRRLPTPGPSQRPEGGNKLRSMKPPPAAANPPKAENAPVKEPAKLTKGSTRHVPPPIAIPPHALSMRLVSSKSKRYRTMSAASLEALDGTANNTVVGSPTSTVRSPTPSGPMTPPIRDPVEAAQEWRNREEMVYMKSGSHRRRRPGVTFDLIDDDAPPKGHRQMRVSRLYAQREDSSD